MASKPRSVPPSSIMTSEALPLKLGLPYAWKLNVSSGSVWELRSVRVGFDAPDVLEGASEAVLSN